MVGERMEGGRRGGGEERREEGREGERRGWEGGRERGGDGRGWEGGRVSTCKHETSNDLVTRLLKMLFQEICKI